MPTPKTKQSKPSRTSEEVSLKEETQAFDPIEEAWTNPTQQPPRETWSDWKYISVESEPVEQELSLRQKRFCELYATDVEFLGNWVQSYLEVYDIDTTKKWWYKTACAASSRLLTNVKVYDYINKLLEECWLNDQFMDKQLLFMASQQADLWTKLWAVKEYNKLKKRVESSDNKGVMDQLAEALLGKIIGQNTTENE